MVRTAYFRGGWRQVVGSAHGGESNRLLITGAAGNMGRLLRPLLRHDDRIVRLGDIVEIDDAQPGDEVVNVDVRDPEAVAKACQDVDAVLHLGGLSTEASFDDVLQVNVVGSQNVLRAVVDAGARAPCLAPPAAAGLAEACLAFRDNGFRVVWAVSDNPRRWWTLAGARALGYESSDDAERFAADRVARFGEPDLTDPVHDMVGGGFCIAPLGEPMN